MAETLTVRPRDLLGKKVGRLRRAGKLPGVVAGHGESTPLETDTHVFELAYRRWGGTTLISLEGLPGGAVPALIHGVSRHPVNGRPLHIDFQRVSLTEKTRAEVPLHWVGESAAVRTHGGVLLHAMERIAIEAFPQDIPRRIDVDLSALAQVDDTIHVSDLRVDITKIRLLADPGELVVKAMESRVEEATPVPAAAAAAAGDEAKPAAGAKAAPAAGAKAAPAAEKKEDKK
ncbi:MAG: 50S ribosomal protein L25 [Chloroflexi bacterium]|nr:50S ribosomal protein L25 [Chloroflexota bacterium]